MQSSVDKLLDLINRIKGSRDELIALQKILDEMKTEAKEPPTKINGTKLSKTEKKVMNLLAKGMTNEQMAVILKIGRRTVETHRYNIQKRLGLSGPELKKFAQEQSR